VGLLIRHPYPFYYISGIYQGLVARNIVEGRGVVVGKEEERTFICTINEKKHLVDIRSVPVFKDDKYYPLIYDVPGYSILLGAIWKITSNYRFIYVQVIQIVLDSLMILLLFSIVRRLFNERAALITAFLYAVYLPEAFLSIHPLRDCWAMFATIAIIYLIIRYRENPGTRSALGVGVLTGLATYLRPNLIFITLVCSIFGIFYIGKKNCLKQILISSIVVAGILIPWWIRNWRIYHRFIPLTISLPQVMWTGLGTCPNQYGFVYSDGKAQEYVVQQGYSYYYGTPEHADILWKRVSTVIKEDPLFYLKAIVWQIPKALFPGTAWGIEPRDFRAHLEKWSFKEWNRVHRAGILAYMKQHPFIGLYKAAQRIFMFLLFLFGLFGILGEKEKLAPVLLLISIPFYFIGISLLIHAEPRYVLPGTWVYLVFSAVFIENLLKRWKHFG